MQASFEILGGGGGGGVAMHFDAWGAMCEIKELLVIPMIKYLKFHPHAASFSLASLQKKTDAENE